MPLKIQRHNVKEESELISQGSSAAEGLIRDTQIYSTIKSKTLDDAISDGDLSNSIDTITAGENISSGDPVYLYNDSGPKIKKVTAPTTSTAYEFNTTVSPYLTSAIHLASGNIVHVYQDQGNSSRVTAIVGSLNSSGDVTFGSETQLHTDSSQYSTCCYEAGNNKIIVVFRSLTSPGYGKCLVCTVSGTTISAGSPVTFHAADTSYVWPIYHPVEDRVVVLYSDASASEQLKAIVGQVSGTSITFGSPTTIDTNTCRFGRGAYDPGTGDIIIGYYDVTNTDAIARTIEITGSSVSAVNSATTVSTTAANAYGINFAKITDSTFAFTYASSGTNVFSTILTISGTTVSAGSLVDVLGPSISVGTHGGLCYDAANDRVLAIYKDGATGDAAISLATYSGTTLTWQNQFIIDPSTNNVWNDIIYDPTTQLTYASFNNNYTSWKTRAGTSNTSTETFTTTVGADTRADFFGIAQEGITLGNSGKVSLLNSRSSVHSGKTPGAIEYIQANGSLGSISSAYPVGRYLNATTLVLTKNP